MEPRSFDHGDQPRKAGGIHRDLRARFNGATIFRSWRRVSACINIHYSGVVSMEPRSFDHGDKRLSRSQMPLRLCRFNGATIFRSWRPMAATMARSSTTSRFNGATIFRSWRRQDHEQRVQLETYPVSMEPRSFDHGDRYINGNSTSSTISRCFNGATIFRSWRPPLVFVGVELEVMGAISSTPSGRAEMSHQITPARATTFI